MSIEEKNNLIASFMAGEPVRIHHNRYHNSWDELIPVVKTIRHNERFPESIEVGIDDYMKMSKPTECDKKMIEGLYTQDINKVYEGVVEFIQWYNNKAEIEKDMASDFDREADL